MERVAPHGCDHIEITWPAASCNYKLLILTMNSLYNVILVSTSKQSKLAKQVNSMVQIDRIEVLFEQNNYKWKNVMHPGC